MEFEGKHFIIPVPSDSELLEGCEPVYLSDDSHIYDTAASQYTKRENRAPFSKYSSTRIYAVAVGDVWDQLLHQRRSYVDGIEELQEEYAQLTGETYTPSPEGDQRNIAESLLYGLSAVEGAEQIRAYLSEMNELIEQACKDISERLYIGKIAIYEVVNTNAEQGDEREHGSNFADHIFARIQEILAEKIAATRAQIEQDTVDFGRDTAQAMAADRRRQESLAKKK